LRNQENAFLLGFLHEIQSDKNHYVNLHTGISHANTEELGLIKGQDICIYNDSSSLNFNSATIDIASFQSKDTLNPNPESKTHLRSPMASGIGIVKPFPHIDGLNPAPKFSPRNSAPKFSPKKLCQKFSSLGFPINFSEMVYMDVYAMSMHIRNRRTRKISYWDSDKIFIGG